MSVYPLVFTPIFKERIWGAQNLRSVFGKDIPSHTAIGESWELADLPHDKTTVRNGPDAGLTIGRIIEREGKSVTGRDDFPRPFPLLVKLLDCAAVLSVQVHPDEATCRRMGRGDFKTECWYVIRAEKNACIYKGLRPGVTRERMEEAITAGTVETLLQKVPVSAGECHFLPAGTPHAIGAGILIAEIQTPSDTTYRVFDWNRVDGRGHARKLHVAEALESIHFDASRDDLSVRTGGVLADCPYFRIEKTMITSTGEIKFTPGVMRVIIILSGTGRISGREAAVPFRAGDTILIPADYAGTVTAEKDPCAFLTVTV
jgi:mannose-6-phosphate isomerase